MKSNELASLIGELAWASHRMSYEAFEWISKCDCELLISRELTFRIGRFQVVTKDF